MKKVRIYPADKYCRCLHGFCPTMCESKDADRIALDLADKLIMFGVKFSSIVIDEIA